MRHLAFFLVVWAYTALASLYAVNTPAWQVPDEPAHYNYVRVIAEEAALPVLQPGDYDQQYLEQIKARKFPAEMPIDSIRYEAHQPPAYYLLLAPLYKLSETDPVLARLLGLRLQSVLWGAVLLALIYRIARAIFPADALLPPLAAGLAAFVPQHLAIAGGVNNDLLAEVVLAGVVLALVRVLRGTRRSRNWLWVGVLLGAGFLTKTTTYVAIGLVLVTVLLDLFRRRGTAAAIQATPRWAAQVLIAGLLVGGLWFARGAATYGPGDWLGLARHANVVVGQPRTLELYPDYLSASADWLLISYRSFWGQFGWMGVLLDERIYWALLVFCVVALAGLLPAHFLLRSAELRLQRVLLSLLLIWVAGTFAASALYSLEFFQAQGRYLFPALGGISILLATGVRGWLATLGQAAARRGANGAAIEWVGAGLLAIAFIALDLICLYRFLIPALR